MMKAFFRWVVIILLTFIAILMVNKGLDLRSLGTDVDGDGIGVYFLGLEINDRFSEERIPIYANGFLVASGITMFVALLLIGATLLKIIGNKQVD